MVVSNDSLHDVCRDVISPDGKRPARFGPGSVKMNPFAVAVAVAAFIAGACFNEVSSPRSPAPLCLAESAVAHRTVRSANAAPVHSNSTVGRSVSAKEPTTGPLPYSTRRCTGWSPVNRSCIFHNVCWDYKRASLMFYTQSIFPYEDDLRISKTWYLSKSGGTNLELSRPLEWTWELGAQAPRRERVNMVDRPTMLIRDYNPQNFGHALMDGVFPAFLTMTNFEALAPDAQILFDISCEALANMRKTFKPVVTRNCHKFRNLFYPVFFNRTDSWKHFIADSHDKPLTCFKSLVIGIGDHKGQGGSQKGLSHVWWEFRNRMLTASGIDPLYRPTEIRTVIVDKWCNGTGIRRRSFEDVSRLKNELSHRMPQLNIEVVCLAQLPWVEQLRLMTETTILITPEGTISYPMLFLPPRSRVIYFTNISKRAHEDHRMLFSWLAWFQVWEYKPSKRLGDFVRLDPSMHRHGQPSGRDIVHRPNIGKLSMFVKQALHETQNDEF